MFLNQWSWVRLVVITALSALLFGCGSGSTTTPDPNSNHGGNTSGNTGGNGGNGGNPTITTGVHLFTSLCDTPRGCPLDEKPYRVRMSLEIQRPNGWLYLTDTNGIDTGVAGDVMIGLSDVGTYRLRAMPSQPVGTRPATANEAIFAIVNGQVTTVNMQFIPQ